MKFYELFTTIVVTAVLRLADFYLKKTSSGTEKLIFENHRKRQHFHCFRRANGFQYWSTVKRAQYSIISFCSFGH